MSAATDRSDGELIAELLRAHRDQIGFLDALTDVQDRLTSRSAPWVIHCWVYNHDKWTDAPDCVLGPYLNKEAACIAAAPFTCTHEIVQLRWRLNPPEWTTTT